MIRRPPRSTLPHTLFPSTTLFLSAVYRARANGDAAWADSRIASAIAARATIDLPDQQKWIEQVAAATGISAAILQQLVELADAGKFDGAADQTIAALLAWLGEKPPLLLALVRPESLQGLFGDKYKQRPTDADRAAVALRLVTATEGKRECKSM